MRVVACAGVLTSHAAAEGTSAALTWNDGDRRAGWGDVALLGATGSVALAGLWFQPDRDDPWRARWGIDEGARNTLRLGDPHDRRVARTASDVLAAVLVTYPAVVEAGVNVAWGKASPDVALQMTVMQLEVLGLTAAVAGMSKLAFSRERPYGRLCGTELAPSSDDCAGRDRYVSFFSAHAAFTFASASNTCYQHVKWGLWGAAPAWVPCATSYSLATTTALLRVAADRHYLTDITTGAVIGAGIGLLVPWFHYAAGESRSEGARWTLGVAGETLAISGTF
jgi:membrane-associated phospholipid phosphatase